MKISDDEVAYLKGLKFSNGHHFRIPMCKSIIDRSTALIGLAAGRRVLHVGCCDHLTLIDRKRSQGRLLHARLAEVAQSCVGLDVDEKALSRLRASGFTVLHMDDASNLSGDFDICIAGDVIEHVEGPYDFLRTLASMPFEILALTTPNLFRFTNFSPYGELINTDHKYWFSPYTLLVAFDRCGYELETIMYCDPVTWRQPIRLALLWLVPKFRDDLLVIARRKAPTI